MSWMAVAGSDITASSGSSDGVVAREVDRRATVTANGLTEATLRGVIMDTTEIKAGYREYFWSDPANQVHQKIWICDDAGGGARSNAVYDRDYGWLYVICQNRLLRLDVAGLINAGYGTAGSSKGCAAADGSGKITPTPSKDGLIQVLHDTTNWASDSQSFKQYPQRGWHGYEHHYNFGEALSLVDGVLYWTAYAFKATVSPSKDLGIWAWRLGESTGWIPVAVIPGVTGGNQAGAIKGDQLGNLYLSIGNQLGTVNGIWQISNPFDLYGDQTVRQVMRVTDQSQVYGYELETDSSTNLPKWLYLSRKNQKYTKYAFDLSTLGRIPWTGDAESGTFDESKVVALGDIFHRGQCVFGCGAWELLGINRDPTTETLWLNYKNGDGEHFITGASVCARVRGWWWGWVRRLPNTSSQNVLHPNTYSITCTLHSIQRRQGGRWMLLQGGRVFRDVSQVLDIPKLWWADPQTVSVLFKKWHQVYRRRNIDRLCHS